MTPLGTTTDRPGRRTVLQVIPTPSTRADDAARGWGPGLGRGFIQVLVARDPPLLLRSRRAKVMAAGATWVGAALLLVALVALLRRAPNSAIFVTPSGTGVTESHKTIGVVAVLAVS